MKNTGISEDILSGIHDVFQWFPAIDQAVLFGSRAKGTFYEGSDIDIALFGKKLNFKELLKISIELDKIELLQTIDLIHFEKIDSQELKSHIKRVGVKIYDSKLTTKV